MADVAAEKVPSFGREVLSLRGAQNRRDRVIVEAEKGRQAWMETVSNDPVPVQETNLKANAASIPGSRTVGSSTNPGTDFKERAAKILEAHNYIARGPTPTPAPKPSPDHSSSGLSTGAKIAIGVVIPVVVIIVAVIVILLCLRRRKKAKPNTAEVAELPNESKPVELGVTRHDDPESASNQQPSEHIPEIAIDRTGDTGPVEADTKDEQPPVELPATEIYPKKENTDSKDNLWGWSNPLHPAREGSQAGSTISSPQNTSVVNDDGSDLRSWQPSPLSQSTMSPRFDRTTGSGGIPADELAELRANQTRLEEEVRRQQERIKDLESKEPRKGT